MSRLNGRKPVEIKLPDLLNGHIPIYDQASRIWNTVDYNTLVSSSANISGSNIFHGDQTISGSLNVTGSVTASYFTGAFVGDGSNITNIAVSGVTGLSLHKIYSGSLSASIENDALRINTDVYVDGIITAKQFDVTIVSSSVLFQSGSTKFGDTTDDTHQFTGSVNITGSLNLTGSAIISNSLFVSDNVTASYFTGAFVGDGSQLFNLTYATTGSNTFYGDEQITGSLTVTGATTLIGPVYISGSHGTPTSPTFEIHGDTSTDGIIKFLPIEFI